MSGRGEPGNQPTPQVDTNQERTPEVAPAQGADTSTQSADAADPGAPPPPAAPNGLPQLSPGPDRWPLRLGITFLGTIALVCIFALIYVSQKPEPPGTIEAADAQATAAEEGPTPTQAGPVAAQVAGETGTLGLLGQIVGVLATVAAAAVGGIAGFLTGNRASDTTAPTGSTGQGVVAASRPRQE